MGISEHEKLLLASLDRHPADDRVAYGHYDPAEIAPLVHKRLLLAAIIPNYIPEDEIKAHTGNDMRANFRRACQYFQVHAMNQREKMEKGLSILNLVGYDRQGIFPLANDHDSMPDRTVQSFLQDEWLLKTAENIGQWTSHRLGERSFYILEAPLNQIKDGLAPRMHDHMDISAHLTLLGAGLGWTNKEGEEFIAKGQSVPSHLVQKTNPGDLVIMGRLFHTSPPEIYDKGQLAIVAGGPLFNEYA